MVSGIINISLEDVSRVILVQQMLLTWTAGGRGLQKCSSYLAIENKFL